METLELPNRELARREVDGLSIALWWVQRTINTYVTIDDTKEPGEPVRIEVGQRSPNEVYMHPFAYQPDKLYAPAV